MRITVNIPDEIASQVQAMGLDVKEYIEEAAIRSAQQLEPEPKRKIIDLEGFFAGVSQHSAEMPVLSEEALHRPSYYEDHD